VWPKGKRGTKRLEWQLPFPGYGWLRCHSWGTPALDDSNRSDAVFLIALTLGDHSPYLLTMREDKSSQCVKLTSRKCFICPSPVVVEHLGNASNTAVSSMQCNVPGIFLYPLLWFTPGEILTSFSCSTLQIISTLFQRGCDVCSSKPVLQTCQSQRKKLNRVKFSET